VTVGKRTITRAALLGAVCLPILPALAQEIDAVRMNFGIDQRFEAGDNLGLDNPSQGNSSISTTRLSFGLISETERQSLAFDVSGALTIQDTPTTDGTETTWGTPRFRLAYDLDGADSALGVNANYSVAFIDTLSFADFINEDGILELPEDFSSLAGTGERTNYGLNATLALGQNAPLGFDLSAGVSGIDYTNVTDPNLFDYNRSFLGARALLRFSPVLTGSVGLRYSTYDASDNEQTYRTRTTGNIGLEYEISSRAALEASLGVTEVNTETLDQPTTNTTSPVGSLGYTYDMPNGGLTADFVASADENGNERLNFVVGRNLELPDGNLSFTLGLTDPEFGDVAPIGSLNWERNLPAGQITAQISRKVSSSNNDDTALTTLVAFGYDQNINDVSGFGLNFTYGESDATENTGQVTRTGISATYRHALTQDWNLNTGVNYRTRDEEGEGQASSPSIFLSIGRNFDFRP
jgi:hypothetical protein